MLVVLKGIRGFNIAYDIDFYPQKIVCFS